MRCYWVYFGHLSDNEKIKKKCFITFSNNLAILANIWFLERRPKQTERRHKDAKQSENPK